MSGRFRISLPELLCALWISGFLTVFFLQDLPNNSRGGNVTWRTDVWNLATDSLPELLNPFDVSHATADGVDSGWHLLPQRWPYAATALTLFAASLLIGTATFGSLSAQFHLLTAERFVIRAGIGLSLQSLWTLLAGRFGFLSTVVLLVPAAAALTILLVRAVQRDPKHTQPSLRIKNDSRLDWLTGTCLAWVVASFGIILLLGGFTPPWDFDVREYHLQGPKEWFQAGRITCLEHNVYTSFPFLSEMLSLDAMVLTNDWKDGAIAGKFLLAQFQVLSAVCVYAIARRWFGLHAALLAVVVYLTTPWTLRISTISYAEGATSFYLVAALMTALIAGPIKDAAERRGLVLIAGLLAGSAMAAKYPGLVSAVIPIGVLLLWARRTSGDVLRTAVLYATGVLFAVGPWLIRNAIDTGNPVYPLLYSVFGATDWSPAMNAKWSAAHSAPEHQLLRIPIHLFAAIVRNDWTSGLLFGLAVPTLVWLKARREVRWMWGMTAWMLFTWWALTHRIDRFWVPVIPVVAVLAGSAWRLFAGRFWKVLLVLAVAFCSVYHLQFWRSGLVGFQGVLMDIDGLSGLVVRPDLKFLNRTLPDDSRVLLVGEAEVFDAEFPLVYNTVFDESIFEKWTADESDDRAWSAERRMKSPADIKATLREHGITHVYVNWQEILRYRRPGSYGYTEYVNPARFTELVDEGILAAPGVLSPGDWAGMSEGEQRLIDDWPGGDTLHPDNQRWNAVLIYQVEL